VSNPDVVVIGGGIVGVATAYFLAAAGAKTTLYEREAIGAGASGRNAGYIGRPHDEILVPLYEESLRHYLALTEDETGVSIPPEPAGVLLVSRDHEALKATASAFRTESPELGAEYLEGHELRKLEPSLAEDVAACRLDMGHPTVPGAVTRAFASLAERHGADLRIGLPATPWLEDGRILGVHVGNEKQAAGSVVVAAGAWSADAMGDTSVACPIEPMWGVIAELHLSSPPRHVLEEISLIDLRGPGQGEATEGIADPAHTSIFSLITADGRSALGASFSTSRPDEAAMAQTLMNRGAGFVPAVADRRNVVTTRTCPRPWTPDGRPLLGPVRGIEGLFLAAGNGAWGISTGPASARIVAEAVLGHGIVARELWAGRFTS
jgi:sarcosine oxidase subunit beta